MRKILYFIVLSFFSSLLLKAEKVNIGILTRYNISKVNLEVIEGAYQLYSEKGKLFTSLFQGRKFTVYILQPEGESLVINLDGKEEIRNINQISTIALTPNSKIKISPIFDYVKPRNYKENIIIRPHKFYPKLQLINNVDIQNYLAGVIKSEVGISPTVEYFKLQSVICRTYAKRNFDRHISEGYQLCDNTHCQAYYGYTDDSNINNAVATTKDKILIDYNGDYVLATFFSNCGGQTQKSENVWITSVFYNKSVEDTFCINKTNAFWNKTIDKARWVNFLKSQGVKSFALGKRGALNFRQPKRTKYLNVDTFKVRLTEIRKRFKLKSTFFSVEDGGDNLILRGRGFGHGVGLCQEGAIRMASLEKSYLEILNFYFKNVEIIDASVISYFQSD